MEGGRGTAASHVRSVQPLKPRREGGRGEGKAAAAELFSLSFYIPLLDFHPFLPPSLPLLLARIVRWEIEGGGRSEWGGEGERRIFPFVYSCYSSFLAHFSLFLRTQTLMDLLSNVVEFEVVDSCLN